MNKNLINVDYFKQVYYKSILPLDKINDFLTLFEEKDLDHVTKTLISIFNMSITNSLLGDLKILEDKKKFLRLCEDDYQSPKILDYLANKFPNSQQIILEAIERSLLSAKKSLGE